MKIYSWDTATAEKGNVREQLLFQETYFNRLRLFYLIEFKYELQSTITCTRHTEFVLTLLIVVRQTTRTELIHCMQQISYLFLCFTIACRYSYLFTYVYCHLLDIPLDVNEKRCVVYTRTSISPSSTIFSINWTG